MDVVIAIHEIRGADHFLMQRDRRVDAADGIFLQGPAQPHQAFIARVAVNDQLGDQAVVMRLHDIAGIQCRIDADAEPAGRMVIRDPARRRQERFRGFGVDSAFDGMAREGDVLLLDGEVRTRRDADLFAHDIDAGNHLGHRMFDLEARVHFDEIKFLVLVQKFHGAGIAVAQRGDGIAHEFADFRPLDGIERRRPRFLQHLLVVSLQRAVAFTKMDRIAVIIGEHLHLDMARPGEILFQVNRIAAEMDLGLVAGKGNRFAETGRAFHDLHAASAAAGRRLDQHRVADVFGKAEGFLDISQRVVGSRHHGYAEFLHLRLRRQLVAHQPDMIRRRSDEADSVLLHDRREVRVFRQEPVARVDGVGVGDGGRGQNRRNVEIALARRGRADADAFIGETDMHGVLVRRRVHRHGLNPHLVTGAVDAERDLAAVGDQDFVEHGRVGINPGPPAPRRTPPGHLRRRGSG